MKYGSSDEEYPSELFLILLIKAGLVPVGAEQDVRHPVRRFAHLLTDNIQVNIRAAFDDQLIMNVTDDEAVLESFHGVAEDVAADGLDDVLHELWTVGFDAFPFLCISNTFIGDGFAAILVFSDTWFHVGEQATGWKFDEEHSAFIKEADPAYFRLDALRDRSFDSAVDVPPKGCDHRVGVSPGVDQRL